MNPFFVLAGLALLVGIFAKPMCEFNANVMRAMPGFLRWTYRVQYLGREPDDPLWVGFTRYAGFAMAAILLVLAVTSRRFG
jgi:hypothetical protein